MGEMRVTHKGKTVSFTVKGAKVKVTPGRRFGRRPVFTVTVTLPGLKAITYPEIQNPEWPDAGGKRFTAEEAARVGVDLATEDLGPELAKKTKKLLSLKEIKLLGYEW